jgi:hypothetical protein
VSRKLASEFERGQQFAKDFYTDARTMFRTTPPSSKSSSSRHSLPE